MGLVAAAAAVATLLTIDRVGPAEAPMSVELPPPGTGSPGTEASSSDRAAAPPGPEAGSPLGIASGRVDGPLHCLPAGCERWRLDLPGPPAALSAGDGVVAAVVGDALHAIDAASGASLWSTRLGGPVRDGTQTVAFDAPVTVAVGDGLVVTSGGQGWVQARDSGDGSLRWSVRLDHRVGAIHLADAVVVSRAAPAGRDARYGEVFAALSTTDGQLLWSTAGGRILSVADGRLLLEHGTTTRALDLRTGTMRYEIAGRALPLGPWLAVVDGLRTRLHDPEDGAAVGFVEGIVQTPPVVVGETWIVVVAPSPTPNQPHFGPRAVGLGLDATRRWEASFVADPASCCVLAAWGGGAAAVGPGDGSGAWVLDGDTGRLLHLLQRSPFTTPGRAAGGRLWVGEAEGGLVVVAPDATVQVAGSGTELLTVEPPVVARAEELLGLRLVAWRERHRPTAGAR